MSERIKHLKSVDRRIKWLERRIKSLRDANKQANFDRAERAALLWLLQIEKDRNLKE